MATTEAVKERLNGMVPAPAQPPQTIHGYLTAYKNEIARALPKHLTADRMSRIVLTECRKVPALLECDPKSLFGAVIQASQLGLEPGGALGHAYLIPFRNKGKPECQLIIGYRGMIDLSRRSGQIVSIMSRAVFQGDHFKYTFGLHEDLTHEPCGEENPNKITHVYAVARLHGGGVQFDVRTRKQIDSIRKQSKAGQSGPWVTHYEEMACKTVIRRLFKYLPVSIEVQRAVMLDDLADAGVSQQNALALQADAPALEERAELPAPDGELLPREPGDDSEPNNAAQAM